MMRASGLMSQVLNFSLLIANNYILSSAAHYHLPFLTGYQKHESKQQQLEKVCLCIAGFLQPLPFIQRLYPSLRECNDGFVDRFLICSPRPKLLLEEKWCSKLSSQRIKSLSPVYSLVSRWHPNGQQHKYTFSDEAKEQYRLFANEMTILMNSQFDGDGGQLLQGQEDSNQGNYVVITVKFVPSTIVTISTECFTCFLKHCTSSLMASSTRYH